MFAPHTLHVAVSLLFVTMTMCTHSVHPSSFGIELDGGSTSGNMTSRHQSISATAVACIASFNKFKSIKQNQVVHGAALFNSRHTNSHNCDNMSVAQRTVFEDGVQKYFDMNNNLHREDGPALIDAKTGATAHYLHGVLMKPSQHRWFRRRGALVRNAPSDIVKFM